LRLCGDRDSVFPLLEQRMLDREWRDAVTAAEIEESRPVGHDLRHTHASRLIALGWDPVEVAKRLGDRVETVLKTYAHEFDARRRGAERRAILEQLYGQDGDQMATKRRPQTTADVGKSWNFRQIAAPDRTNAYGVLSRPSRACDALQRRCRRRPATKPTAKRGPR
jgi:hypothetical protein